MYYKTYRSWELSNWSPKMNVLMFEKVLPISNQLNLWRPVKRNCMKMLGLTRLSEHKEYDQIICNSPTIFELPWTAFHFIEKKIKGVFYYFLSLQRGFQTRQIIVNFWITLYVYLQPWQRFQLPDRATKIPNLLALIKFLVAPGKRATKFV